MDTRLFGLTSEYSVVFSADGQPLSAEEAGHRLFGPLVSAGHAAGVLLSNGGRLRLDVADRPGYTTPDCGSAADLVVHDKAGERILEGLLTDASQHLGEERDIWIVKTGAGPAGRPFSCQEDYLVARRGEFGRLAGVLIPFLVTRQLICGTGAVARTPRGAVYCLSRPGGPGTGPASRSRPLISTRDEPHAQPAGFRRLHVSISDPAMSETTTLLKAGSSDLVLRMAEAGTVMPDLTLLNPVQAMGEVSLDITGRGQLRLADGRRMSALDIQREYLTRATDFTGSHGADAFCRRVLALWERTLDAIEAGDPGAIARQIDWAIKYQLIERYRAAHDLPLSAPQVARTDLAYHDILRGTGLYCRLQRGGAVERTTRDIDIFEAKTIPPARVRYRRAG